MPVPHALLLAAFVAAPALPSASEELLKPAEIDSLGKKLGAYIEARTNSEGIDKALEEVAKEIEKVHKRLKRDPLSLPGEMGKAHWAALEYAKKGSVAKGKVDVVTEPAYWEKKDKLTHAVWIPSKYDPRKAWPLILCVPDLGQKPGDHLTEDWIDPQIRDSAILLAVPTAPSAEALLKPATGSEQTGMGNVAAMYFHATRRYAVDFDRVYIAGRGAGVELALAYGGMFADRFAGIVGRSGDAGHASPENLRNLPTYFAGAGAKAGELADKLKALGYDNATLQPEGKEADIWTWMQSHPRVAHPEEVVLYVGTPAPNRMHWIDAQATDAQGPQYVKAKIDRAANTIHVEGEGVQNFTVYFNDVLLDLDKPVKVIANGTANERTVPRSLQRTLDCIALKRSDPGRFYVQSIRFELPPKPKPKTP
jgi:hypothetical protein